VIAAIVEALSSEQYMILGYAAAALILIDPEAVRPVPPALVNALKDPDPLVRKAAAQALRWIDPDAAARAGVR
jgi:HEAT repeat protein